MNIKIISSHYKEDLGFLKRIKYPHIVYSHNPDYVFPEGVSYKIIPNKGLDTSSYYQYIVDNYDRLDDVCIFIHGHEMSYHQNDTIDSIINNLDVTKFRYCSLSNVKPYLLSPNAPVQSSLDFDREGYRKVKCAWDYVFKKWFGEIPKEIQFRPCPQFLITKDIILKNPKALYEDILNWTYNNTCVPDGWVPYVNEYMYHYVFFRSAYYFELRNI